MSTVSSSLSSVVAGKGNFGHFHINRFVDTDIVNATELHSKIQSPNANQVSKFALDITSTTKNSMAQSSRPASGQNTTDITPTVAPGKTIQKDQSSSSPRGGFGALPLELVELNSNQATDGVLGPNKDGRVRNPVPSKLKGKTDNKKGNFGVMHMGASTPGKKEAPGKDASAERDAAARRTSENTASRAKAAANEKYAPPKKRGLEAAKNEGGNRASPFASRDDHKQRARPLTPDETKYEQARLLTLLRSINPVTVVDQVCKAVAYFGGIPGAPPPEDGIFPESANTRETGALFIGWLAEIFPDLSANPEPPPIPRPQEPPSAKGKRGRGRPPRDSKGPENGTSEAPGPANGFGFGPAVQAPTWGLPQSVALVNTAPPMAAPPIPVTAAAAPLPSAAMASPNFSRSIQAESDRPATPLKGQIENHAPDTESTSKRRRGRPKGSRNKGKEVSAGSESTSGLNNVESTIADPAPSEQNVQHQPAAVAKMVADKPVSTKESPMVPVTDANNKSGQPQLTYSAEHWNPDSNNNHNHTSSILPPDQYSPEERAVIEAFQTPAEGPTGFSSTQGTPVNNGTPTAGGTKRKRGPNKPKTAPMTASQNMSGSQSQTSHTSKNISPLPAPAEIPVVQKDTSTVQWESVPPMVETLVPPPPKRQRKPKVPGTNGPSTGKKPGSSVVSNATPPIPPSSIPDSPATSVQSIQQTQQNTPVTRPADGLEAHYARFQQDLGQQNGRSITPTTSTITPQGRQHQKSASIPQSTPQQMTQQTSQQPQQVQMQHQTSQQGHPRDDQNQKMTQNVPRNASNSYFPNHSGANYVSQYSSNPQANQRYGAHQPSPQMGNSYRAGTMTQASPQFAHAENSYRTASPHTIAQSSPSFSQPDTSYRTSSSLANPSPTYSQPEASYNPRTTSIATATPSYSQPDYKPSALNQTSSYTRTTPTTHQQQSYNQYADPSYIDLPTLDLPTLGHTSASAYGQTNMNSLGGGSSRSNANTNSIYGTSSGLGNAFDGGANDLLRNNRAGSGSYGAGGSAGGFDGGEEMRQRLMKGMLGRDR
ncbi:hypothetical protein BOTNAR_0002g00630 [Botryotinia narcissicola]|uniref:Uncharacterized protein n=1 Tax=Botryotinia narcissicola TaxID=278944 RepID=A0A4Z1J9G1_9HELO|nr:hypothetical protein BOTNAR_0002g00630 [Botryotinia narcissicola]